MGAPLESNGLYLTTVDNVKTVLLNGKKVTIKMSKDEIRVGCYRTDLETLEWLVNKHKQNFQASPPSIVIQQAD